jgi:hypothetical protein
MRRFVKALRDRCPKQGEIEAVDFLDIYLSGADAATEGERASEMICGLKEFVAKDKHLLSSGDIENLQEAREAYGRDNLISGIGGIE